MFDDQIQNNKLQILGKLTASLIHEIRNPLSAIQLNLDYLKMLDADLPDEANSSIKDCNEALVRIQSLIEMLLEFSRKPNAESNDISINLVTLDAIEIMKENIILVLNFLNHMNCGENTLHVIIDQYAHQ